MWREHPKTGLARTTYHQDHRSCGAALHWGCHEGWCSSWVCSSPLGSNMLTALLHAALCAMVMWSFLQLLFGAYFGPAGRTVFALLGAIVFSGYIIFDTEQLIARFELDDYIMASVALYLVRQHTVLGSWQGVPGFQGWLQGATSARTHLPWMLSQLSGAGRSEVSDCCCW